MKNKQQRAKTRAHRYFDLVWHNDVLGSSKDPRTRAYAWLARKLGLKRSECHISLMDIDSCNTVAEICKEKLVRSAITID